MPEPVDIYRLLASRLHPTLSWLLSRNEPYHHEPSRSWFVTGYDDVRALLTDRRLGCRSSDVSTSDLTDAQRALAAPLEDHFARWLVFADDDRLEPVRRAFRQVLNGEGAESWSVLFGRLAAARVTTWPEDTDLVADFIAPFTFSGIAAVLGVPAADGVRVGEWGLHLLRYLSLDRFDDGAVAAAADALAGLGGYFDTRYLPEAEGAVADCFRDLMALGTDPPNLLAVFTQLLTGGLEPTRTSLALGYAWLTRPAHLSAFAADPDGYVDEVTRLTCPFHFAPRTAVHDLVVGGRRIAAGSRVTLVLAGANRDPRVFPRPGEIDPRRPLRRHLSFGRGPHFCMGSRLATQLIRAGLTALTDDGNRPPANSPTPEIARTAGMTWIRTLRLDRR